MPINVMEQQSGVDGPKTVLVVGAGQRGQVSRRISFQEMG
jgi:hypothetical protein